MSDPASLRLFLARSYPGTMEAMTVSRSDRHEARASYPTDLTDAEWHAIAPYMPTENLTDDHASTRCARFSTPSSTSLGEAARGGYCLTTYPP
jgi:hypothetical protein